MNEILDLVFQAHGGLDSWNKFNKVPATIVAAGGLLAMKGLEVRARSVLLLFPRLPAPMDLGQS